jgi:hypothetical protein
MIIPEEPEIKSNVIKMLKGKKELPKKSMKKAGKSPHLVKSNSKIIKTSRKSPNDVTKNLKISKPLFTA